MVKTVEWFCFLLATHDLSHGLFKLSIYIQFLTAPPGQSHILRANKIYKALNC